MSVTDSRLLRTLVAAVVLPHELAHALPARLAGLDVTVTILPEWDGEETPLARFNAPLSPTTPVWLVRVIAVAPLPLALLVAALAGTVVSPDSALVVPALLVLSFWGSLSHGDLAVATQPLHAREHGEFLAPPSPRAAGTSLLLTPVTVVLVGLLLLR